MVGDVAGLCFVDVVGCGVSSISSVGMTCGVGDGWDEGEGDVGGMMEGDGAMVEGNDDVVRAISVLPNPPEPRTVLFKDLRTLKAGDAAFSKMSCAILSPAFTSNLR